MQVFKQILFGRKLPQITALFLVYRRINYGMKMSSFANIKFDNTVLKALPLDEENSRGTRTVPGACYSLIETTPVENPELVVHSESALNLLGISIDNSLANSNEFAEYFSGNKLFSGSQPAAHCYCGHQFGYFSGQLGDGAAIYLGEVENSKGERWELQLKGAGKTPYSRNADGRKVLRSSIREFLCSEAMYYLGIPTTRAGTCVTSDTRVMRDIFYDGHPTMERCTIVSRIAPTFLRFGSFEIFKPMDRQTGREGPSVGRTDILYKMLDYVLNSYFKEIADKYPDEKERAYLEFYKEVVRRTAGLAAAWQCVGFCHGVLNTDNMSILGITIDYGPFGFMEYFDSDYICNGSDNNGRYSYKKQPEICKWNLLKFAEAIKAAIPLDETKSALNEIYDDEFGKQYYSLMRKKLGLNLIDNVNDEDITQKLLWTMQETNTDFTNTFRLLSTCSILFDNSSCLVENLLQECQPYETLKKKNTSGVSVEKIAMLLQLADSNPNLLNQLGVTIEDLNELMEKAEKEKKIKELTADGKKSRDEKLWIDWLQLYRERLNLETKDMDDTQLNKFETDRKCSMNTTNPRFVLRNYMAQEAIEAAEEGDFSKVRNLFKLMQDPYSQNLSHSSSDVETDPMVHSCNKYTAAAPSWAMDLRVT